MPLRSQLTLNQSQKLVMTPSLQNSLRILQLSQLELATELRSLLDSNIMLESVEGERAIEELGDEEYSPAQEEEGPLDLEVEIHAEYDEYFTEDQSTGLADRGEEAPYDPLNILTEEHRRTLTEELLWQLTLSGLSPQEELIGRVIINGLNDDGFLVLSLDEILTTLRPLVKGIRASEVESVLQHLQEILEPAGVAARTVQESLLIQLRRVEPQPEWYAEAKLLLERGHSDLLRFNLRNLMRIVNVDEERLRMILAGLRSLNPRPGNLIGGSEAQGIEPDLLVRLDDGRLVVSLNESIMPRLRINPYYRALYYKLKRESSDATMMGEHLSEARNVIRNLGSRFDTLLKVGEAVVRHQSDFFVQGERGLKPLLLKDIAEELEFNESTISRAVAGKYIMCPSGTYELSYFFTNQASADTTGGGDSSSAAVRAVLQEIIEQENPEKPYSDNKLVALLAQEGHKIARRTVAKYRDQLGIPSSTDRRRMAQP